MSTTDLQIKKTKPSRLKPHPKNVRLHDERNIGAIMTSLEEFGQRTPVVVNKAFQVLKGNGTLEAIKRLGWDEVQYVQVTFLSPEKELAYMIADNKTGDLSEFDFAGLYGILKELQDVGGIELEVTGFESFELKPLFNAQNWQPKTPSDVELTQETAYRIQFNESQTRIIKAAYERHTDASVTVAEYLTGLCRQVRGAAVKRKD